MVIDLTQLPDPTVIEDIDFEVILARRKQRLLAAMPAALRDGVAAALALETEPLTILLQENACTEMVLRQRINEGARAVMLARATGPDLDVVAANLDTRRKVIRPADPDAVPPTEAVMEGDDELRVRAQQAFERMSVAGPRGAYIGHALSADDRVADVSADSPAPAEVVVSVLAHEGDGTASAELLAVVEAALSDEDVRPVSDRLTVQGAHIVPYAVAATLYVYPGPEAEPVMAAAETALKRYTARQHRLGRDIRRSALYAALHVEGIQRVELHEPIADMVLAGHEAGYCTSYTLTPGGTDE